MKPTTPRGLVGPGRAPQQRQPLNLNEGSATATLDGRAVAGTCRPPVRLPPHPPLQEVLAGREPLGSQTRDAASFREDSHGPQARRAHPRCVHSFEHLGDPGPSEQQPLCGAVVPILRALAASGPSCQSTNPERSSRNNRRRPTKTALRRVSVFLSRTSSSIPDCAMPD